MTILIVGVNGTGKTTSAAKLAQLLKSSGEKVILAAADTFRAAAVDQLKTWADRISIPVVTGAVNADPASVAFDAASRAKAEGCTVLIIDTAGRLHTKSNLMDELSKIRRVVEKVTPITETLFVLDGTTGQNGITQARTFSESTNLTGIIVTKVDGSTKGGIALATERELGIPIKFIGTGESINDLSPFDAEGFVAALVTEP
jgi:fused signal recognition particle receptor